MKKLLICILLSTILVVQTAFCVAPNITQEQWESLLQNDIEELISFRDLLNMAIVAKGGVAVAPEKEDEPESASEEAQPFSAGVYEVGKNIKAGSYRFDFSNMTYGAIINLYATAEDQDNGIPLDHQIVNNDTASFIYSLEDGNILSIKLLSGIGKITIAPVTASWMP